MSVWTLLSDSLSALNAIGMAIVGLPDTFFHILISLMLAAYYPLALVIAFAQAIWAYVYQIFAAVLNLVISVANIPITMLQMYLNLPSPWISMLYISIMISVSIRSYKWFKEIRGWIPTLSGDSGGG